jgi:hypothetical protein
VPKKKKSCLQEVGDCVQGDSVRVECRKPADWKLFRMTEQHKGWRCVAKKNAKATILKKYTNVKP